MVQGLDDGAKEGRENVHKLKKLAMRDAQNALEPESAVAVVSPLGAKVVSSPVTPAIRAQPVLDERLWQQILAEDLCTVGPIAI